MGPDCETHATDEKYVKGKVHCGKIILKWKYGWWWDQHWSHISYMSAIWLHRRQTPFLIPDNNSSNVQKCFVLNGQLPHIHSGSNIAYIPEQLTSTDFQIEGNLRQNRL